MSATDVIVLSSTERPSTYNARSPLHTSDNLFELSTPCLSPLSLMSPSELFKPSTRSKYFEAPCRKDTPRKRENKEPKEGDRRDNLVPATTKGDMTEAKPKRRRRKPADESLGETAGNASKKISRPKKPFANNASKRGEPGNKTLKGRVAKSGYAHAEGEEKGAVVAASSTSNGQDHAKTQSNWAGGDLQLEEAVKRRLDWTPPKDTPKPVIELDDDRSPESIRESTNMHGFGSLLSSYNFSDTAASAPQNYPQFPEDGEPTKRRRIKLVTSKAPKPSKSSVHDKVSVEDTHCPTISQAEKKQKKQGKRISTLTARVTARYAADDMEDGMAIAGEATTNGRPVRKAKSRSRAIGSAFDILSPEAATKTLDEQDLVFGTCSQLEREDSPTALRDTQMAIRASENSISQEYQSQSDSTLSSLGSASVSRFTAPRDLWSVAARDLDGSLVQAETLNTVDIPTAPNAPPGDRSSFAKESEGRQREKSLGPDYRADLPKDKAPISNGKPVPPQVEADECNGSVEAHQMPQYSSYTYAELCCQIAAFGFKPLKSRQKMIELLQKCWESKHGAGTKAGAASKSTLCPSQDTVRKVQEKLGAKLPSKASSRDTPKPGRGNGSQKATTTSRRKPATRKHGKPRTTSPEIEEIEDSEDEAIPSPRRLPVAAAQSLPISTVPPRSPARGSSTATNTSRRTSLPDLASQISKAVRAQPRSLSSACARPNWYEKILMYDPIILEDFATWLNTEGLGLVGEDREVGAGFLREWCESKGICCCWRKVDAW